MRLAFLLSAALLVLANFPCAAQSSAAPSAAPQVQTESGLVEGSLIADRTVRAFKGIPYAAPPVGDLRWKPPQPATPWRGVLAAKDFGHRCFQFIVYDMVFRDPGPSEDCLTLNIWTPAHAAAGSLPVMVWIYGGGFAAGSTSEPRQDGQFLAHRGVVVVSMNYRLGMLGFLALPGLAAESPHHASGNYGLLDQAAAIAWVKRNISAFGGDPANITIFGQSAGSFSVSCLMASPLSKNLIAKAIGESGAAFFSHTLPFVPLATAEAHDSSLVEKALGTSDPAALRKVPAAALAANKAFYGTRVFPQDVDGYFLPASVPSLYASGQQAHIPLLAGTNADEQRSKIIFARHPTTIVSFTAQAHKDFGPHAEDFLRLYPAATNAEAIRSAGDFASDDFIVYSTWRWIQAQAATGGAPLFRYRLDLPAPTDPNHPAGAGAFHSDDIEYVFATLDSRPGALWRPRDRRLSTQIQQYWTNFARTGNPNGPGLPNWPLYQSATKWQLLHLDAISTAQPDTQRDRYLFLDRLWSTKP